jgi:hypothetical protein
MSADQEEECVKWSNAPVGAIHEGIEECSVLCGHENPFDGWVPFLRIIPLRIDSLVEVLAAFVKVISEKSKPIYQ